MRLLYDDKTPEYFATARTEILPLLPPVADRVLEIGCGAGQTVRWLRDHQRIKRAWGIELFEPAAAVGRPHFEAVHVGDAEKLIDTAFDGQQFELVLCLDVLEHMVDPWRFVARIERLLVPGGTLIVSVPNVRCLSVLLPLAVLGRWRYTEEGILDRTHLRFFTRESAIALATSQGLVPQRCIANHFRGTSLATLERWTFGLLENLTAVQFLVASKRVS